MKRKISWDARIILIKIFAVLRDTSRSVGKFEGFNMAMNVLRNPICDNSYEKILKELDRLIAIYKKGQDESQRLYQGKHRRVILQSLRMSKRFLEEVRG